MLRAVLLLVDTAQTWDRIVRAQRGLVYLLGVYWLPLVALTAGAEVAGVLHWGLGRQEYTGDLVRVAPRDALAYGVAQVVLSLGALLVGAAVARRVSASLRAVSGYPPALTLVASAMGPFFLARLLDALPGLNTWLCFGVGVALTIPAFYHGVPRLLRPDPAKSLGLFLTVFLVCAVLAGLAHFMAQAVLHGQMLPALNGILLKLKLT